MENINVLGQKEYSVCFGKTEELLYKYTNRKVFFILDSNVNVDNILSHFESFYSFRLIALEENKTIDTYSEIISLLSRYSFSKSDLIIALGGGITLDIAGFVASSYKRGIDVVYVPTTLLAMVDASIGSKNALNFKDTKNMIGSFYDPIEVIIDSSFLKTLPIEEKNNGMIEAIKMGLTIDSSILDETNIDALIEKAVRAKIKIVNEDYYDLGIRHILNFGHTLGHAIELLNPKFKHGFAVGAGMLFFITDKELKEKVYQRLKEIYDVDEYIDFIKTNRYQVLDAINQDKKVMNSNINCVFLNAVEKPEIRSIEIEKIDNLIKG